VRHNCRVGNAQTNLQATDTVDELTVGVAALFRTIEALRSRDAEAAQLTPTEYRALARICEIGQKTPKKLAISMGMSTGAITAVTDRLVARGLLERVANENDRRSVILQSTPEGYAIMARSYGVYRNAVREAVEHLPEPHLAELCDALERMAAVLDTK